MADLKNEKIGKKVFRIIVLCLVFVITAVTVAVYFFTKKSYGQTFDRYMEIVKKEQSLYPNSLFMDDGSVNVRFTNSVALANASQNTSPYDLLSKQYFTLLQCSSDYFLTYINIYKNNGKVLTRDKMNTLYEKVDALESLVINFDNEKAELEELTKTSFNPTNASVLDDYQDFLVAYQALINGYIDASLQMAYISVEAQGIPSQINDDSAKLLVHFAIIYATNFIVDYNLNVVNNKADLLTDITSQEIFTLTKDLYNKDKSTLNISINADLHYSYLVGVMQDIQYSIANTNKSTEKLKEGKLDTNQQATYSNMLENEKCKVKSFLQEVENIVD